MQEHQTAEKWNNSFLERHQNKTNPSRFQMEQTFEVTFPLFCLWVAWFSFKQSSWIFFFTPELNNSVFTVEFLSFPKQKTKFIPVPYKSEEELSEEGFPIGEFAKINSSCLFLCFVAWVFLLFGISYHLLIFYSNSLLFRAVYLKISLINVISLIKKTKEVCKIHFAISQKRDTPIFARIAKTIKIGEFCSESCFIGVFWIGFFFALL